MGNWAFQTNLWHVSACLFWFYIRPPHKSKFVLVSRGSSPFGGVSDFPRILKWVKNIYLRTSAFMNPITTSVTYSVLGTLEVSMKSGRLWDHHSLSTKYSRCALA